MFINKFFVPFLPLSIVTCCSLLTDTPVSAQSISSDGTLPTPTEVTPTATGVEIKGGTTRGGNLFHSFKDFSIPSGSEAAFNNAPDIVNILNRVTGGNISNIDGLLSAKGTANLFLINPAGIIFGENASLNIGGSFFGSTANSILFEDGEFSATDLKNPPVLTINAPIGLQLRETAGEIVVRGTGNNLTFDLTSLAFIQGETPPGLQVNSGETLALVGNGVKLEGGNLLADRGRIEIGSINSPSLVNLVAGKESWTLDYSDVSSFQDIKLSDRASIDVSSTIGSGSIQIQGKNVILDGGSAIFSFTGSQPSGTIQVNASDSLKVTGVSANGQVTSALYTAVSPDGIAKGGDLAIATNKLIVRDGAQIGADTYGIGSAGIITVKANESVLLSGTSVDNVPTALGTFVQPGATGSGSQLNLETNQLTIEDGAQLITATLGDGSGAILTAKVSSLLELKGTAPGNEELPSAISSAVLLIPDIEPPTGDGGKINLEAGKLIVSDGAQVTVSNEGLGDAGNINIVSPSISLSEGGEILAETTSGLGGNINLKIDDTLTMRNSSSISAKAINNANGGNINIDANFIVAFPNQNNDILANAKAGLGGDINITTQGIFGIKERPQNPFTNDIDASSQFNLDGNVNINTPDVEVFQETAEAPQKVVEQDEVVAGVCDANQTAQAIMHGKTNTFVVNGKGGIPPEPTEPFSAETLIINGQSVVPGSEEEKALQEQYPPIMTSQGAIYPARGIVKKPDGSIYLTAYPTDNTQRLPNGSANCGS